MKEKPEVVFKTEFAPAEREGFHVILKQMDKIKMSKFVREVISEIPLMFFILNSKRQFIYGNHLMTESLGYNQMEDLLSLRPGEIFHCVNANINPGGCGTSKFCQYCGIVNTLLKSHNEDCLAIGEVRLTTIKDSVEHAHDYEVNSKPFVWEGERFFIVTLSDISEKKRKEHLERIFFHDLLNKAGSVDGLLDILLQTNNTDQAERLKGYVQRGMKELLNDIAFQREIIKAEKGELTISKNQISSLQIIKNIRDDSIGFYTTKKVEVVVGELSLDIKFYCDQVLLNRVLTNLVKNAIEASKSGDVVNINTSSTENAVLFSVHNPSVMPESAQLQIFQRSFSTKGAGRGIGTYSVKLFTEQYLNGKVSFESNTQKGTTFFIELPLG